MRRIFADLHLCADLKNFQHVSRMVHKASMLGYRMVAVPLSTGFSEKELQPLRSVCSEANVDMALRVDLKPKTPKELLQDLRRLRRRFEIVAVSCNSKSVARQAAKDRRVDLLSFPSLDFRERFFDASEAELASNSLAFLEVDMKPLLVLEGPVKVRLLSSLRREVAIAKKADVPVVISSGVSDVMLLRKPREMAALALLFDLDEASSLRAVSENPLAIIKRNREKLGAGFVAPGIRVIRRGRDC